MASAFSPIHPTVHEVTARIIARSTASRAAYLALCDAMQRQGAQRGRLSCTNLAHAFAASPADDKLRIREIRAPNLGIVTAYNDMLSAHQPYASYPDFIKRVAREAGATAQVAGGVPAMCDGVTQGQPGMELSLLSRDVIAMSTAIALAHHAFDAVLCLGICDKIVPGLLIGALQSGHLPAVFVPAGPMASGLSNKEKAKVRQLHAEGKATQEQLMEAEAAAYHSAGTCTFYGTANSNQFLMECAGLHVPGAAFVAPNTPLRQALTQAATERAVKLANEKARLADLFSAETVVNGIVGLLATGGSTNHTMHWVTIAAAAGWRINWDDFDALGSVVPLLARIYPNGAADVNTFHALGGTGFVIRELLQAGLMHERVQTIAGQGLSTMIQQPSLNEHGDLVFTQPPSISADETVLRTGKNPFAASGGLRVLQGNLGKAIVKISAVEAAHQSIEAPALVFDDQDDVLAAFKRGELDRDAVIVVRGQGPRANGMPELHKLTPALSVVQQRGYRTALLTDGRMSGASGSVLAAIHVTPEAQVGGAIGRIRSGDIIAIDAAGGTFSVKLSDDALQAREPMPVVRASTAASWGRGLLASLRLQAAGAEAGGGVTL